MSLAGDEDGEGPVLRVHEIAGGLSAGGVERRGAAPVGALHAAARHLPLHPLPAICTLLQERQRKKKNVAREQINGRVKAKEVQGKEMRREETRGG